MSEKVGLVGTGMVGASFAFALTQAGCAKELVLVDLDTARAEGEAMDLNHGLAFVGPMKVSAGSYEDLRGAVITVVCAGANQKPGQSRLDLLRGNAAVMRAVVPRIVAANPGGLIVIATNPVDILTWLSAEYAALAPGRVFGSGTVLDTARFRFLLAEHFRVDPRSVHGWIIGEHGDHSVPVWSATSIGGMPVSKLAGPNGEPPSTETLNHIYVSMRDAAQAIIKRKSATYYAIGLSLLRIVEAVLKNQRAVLSVTHPLAGAHGASGMSLSLPCVVGRDGVESTIELPLDGPEHAAFLAAGAALRARLAELD